MAAFRKFSMPRVRSADPVVFFAGGFSKMSHILVSCGSALGRRVREGRKWSLVVINASIKSE